MTLIFILGKRSCFNFSQRDAELGGEARTLVHKCKRRSCILGLTLFMEELYLNYNQ